MRTFLTVCTLLGLLAAASPARAEGSRRHVLRIDGVDVWVDLGTADGVTTGSVLTLYDVVVATHPISKKQVRDAFPVGTLRVTVAGKKLSVAQALDDKAAKRASAGDEVELGSAAVVVTDPWDDALRPREPAEEPAEATAPAGDPAAAQAAAARRRRDAEAAVAEAEAIEQAWAATLGKPAEERIAIWEAHLAKWPRGVYAASVRAEITGLRAQIGAALAREEAREAAEHARDRTAWQDALEAPDLVITGPLAYVPPRRVYEGSPFELAFIAVDPAAVKAAWVNVRGPGESTFERLPLAVEAGGALRATVPAREARPPAVEYFVEILYADGSAPEAVVGSPEQPARVAVDASVEEPPRDLHKRSRVTVFADYVDFDGPSRNFDQYAQFEADFMYRFRGPVHAMRLGFAVMGGIGGPKDDIRDGLCMTDDPGGTDPCRRVYYNYSWVELEFRITPLVAIMVRPMLGGGYRTSRETPDFEEFRSSAGVRGRVRIGREEETNLALGVSLQSSFGTLFEAAFTWDVVPRFPIVLSTQVTDQPVAENFGVRLIADVGWRGTSWFYPSLRLSYQARNIALSGVSAGLAMNFDW
jgi:hypothetical protein